MDVLCCKYKHLHCKQQPSLTPFRSHNTCTCMNVHTHCTHNILVHPQCTRTNTTFTSHLLTHTHTHTRAFFTCSHIHTQVVLDFQYVPRYAQDTAAIVEGEGHPAPFGTSPLVDHHTSERYATGESNLNDTQDASQEDEGELSHHNSREEGLHLANLEASQDPELVLNPTWPSASSQVGTSELGGLLCWPKFWE